MSEDKPGNWLIALSIAFTNVSFKNNKYNANTIIDVSNENSIDCLSLKNNNKFLFVSPKKPLMLFTKLSTC